MLPIQYSAKEFMTMMKLIHISTILPNVTLLGNICISLMRQKNSVDIPLIASINCVSNQDWHSFAKKIEETGVDALELNIYILPSDWRRSGEDNEKIYYDIISEVRNYVNLPIAVKIGYYFSSLAQSVKKLSESGIKGSGAFQQTI